MEYRILEKEEIKRVTEIDRTEVIEYIYSFREGKLELEKEHWEIGEWSLEEKQEHLSSLHEIFERRGFIFGALKNSKMIGIIALNNEFIGMNKDQLNLAGLWVSNKYRKKGVAGRLVELVKTKATELGAKKLYVSATPSLNTVTFYMNRGFELAEEINERLYELEPEDIHMELKLT